MNQFAPKHEASKDLWLIDFSETEIIIDGIKRLKEQYPQCKQVFGLGFSLGGNYVLRSVGAAATNPKDY
jgi:predicted esterase